MNMALTKSMSSNHKQALELCDKALPLIGSIGDESLPEDTAATSKRHHTKNVFKYWLKKAALQKRASSFKESYSTLLDLEARIR